MTEETRPRAGTRKPGPEDVPTSACPEAAALAAYVDGGLDEGERRRLEDHASRCEACYFVLRETGRVVREMEEGRAPALRRKRRLTLGASWLPLAATLVVGLGGVTLWRQLRPAQNPADAAVAPLVEALGERRLFEARLAGGFRHGPLVGPRRGGGVPDADQWALLAAAAEMSRRAETDATVENRQALAAAHLLVGEADRAVEVLTALADARPGDARIQNDLAAALLVRAAREDRAGDVPRALEAATRAAEAAPGWSEALFNRALALETLNRVEEARWAWTECARALEPAGGAGGWIEVVEEHRRRLEARPEALVE